jgi:ATP-dependent Clp protease adaptor protein ClpS
MDDEEIKSGEALEVKETVEVKTPSYFRVFLINDNYTTMDFVVRILEQVFRKNTIEATQIMLHVHKRGRGLAGVFTREIAETKVATVHEISRQHGFPLKCDMEKE